MMPSNNMAKLIAPLNTKIVTPKQLSQFIAKIELQLNTLCPGYRLAVQYHEEGEESDYENYGGPDDDGTIYSNTTVRVPLYTEKIVSAGLFYTDASRVTVLPVRYMLIACNCSASPTHWKQVTKPRRRCHHHCHCHHHTDIPPAPGFLSQSLRAVAPGCNLVAQCPRT
jgi:hypothetical protein